MLFVVRCVEVGFNVFSITSNACWSVPSIGVMIVRMRVQLTISTWPFARACLVKLIKGWVPRDPQNSLKALDVKHILRSVTVLVGSPKLRKKTFIELIAFFSFVSRERYSFTNLVNCRQ